MDDQPVESLSWARVQADERTRVREPDDQNLGANRPLTGLAFSGGGIRSATFNLGILQALAELGLLRRFDYLSCVSGGGYIGGWLSAFIQRHGNGRVEEAESKLCTGGAEHPAIRFLRGYSNYLTPRASLLSADTLSAIATYLRNLYLNLSLLVLALATLLLVPPLLVRGIRELANWQPSGTADLAPLFTGGFGFLIIALAFIGLNLGRSPRGKRPFHARQTGVLGLIVVPLVLSAWFLAYGLYAGSGLFSELSLAHWTLLGAAIYLLPYALGAALGYVLDRRDNQHRHWPMGKVATMLARAAIAGALGGALLAGVARLASLTRGLELHSASSWLVSAFGTALLLNAYSLTVVAHIGLMGRDFSHGAREWWSRLGGWLLLIAVTWAALFGIVFAAPGFFRWATQQAHDAYIAAGGITWALSTLIGVLLGRSATTAASGPSTWRDYVARAMPYVFVLGLLALLALGLHQLLTLPDLCSKCAVALPASSGTFLAAVTESAASFQRVPLWVLAALAAFFGALAAVLAWQLDVNLFALYYFYRQRLARCYLGASRDGLRQPHPFTGFDPRDDLTLTTLCSQGDAAKCQRPYPIFNTAMNLVGGKELAWQERRAAAFAFTPLACGYGLHLPDADHTRIEHYRPTAQYMDGVWLGSAMAISGAAASPNMGYHSSPALTFLMTVFNVRLGHWSPNPANDSTWTQHDPLFGGGYLLRELFGKTDLGSPFVYLSDGGHFENLGIYELVRRRCACIVAIDAGQDADGRCDDLGNAIRKCYADFGVTIEIDTSGMKSSYFALGRVHYPDAPDADLLYIKPNLIGGEPADLANYRHTHPQFPHQSTADQWFDESQFESYRKLGHHIGRSVLAVASAQAAQRQAAAGAATDLPLTWICALLRERAQRSP